MRGASLTFRGDLLIDGYNVLHAAGLARRSYGPGEFERSRRRLLRLLGEQLFDRERRRTTVVFDAPEQSLGPPPPAMINGIRVLFADGEADTAIEKLIQQNSAPRRLYVVSSDHRLQRAARRRRSKFLDSETFLIRIARRLTPEERRQLAEPQEKREGLSSPGEVDAWLRAFGEIDASLPAEDHDRPLDRATSDAEQSVPARQQADRAGRSAHPTSDEQAFWERRVAELWDRTDVDDDGNSAERG